MIHESILYKLLTCVEGNTVNKANMDEIIIIYLLRVLVMS